MNANTFTTVTRLARSLVDAVPYHWKHFSFITRKREVYSVGWNQPYKTHPLAQRFGHRFNAVHSELHAILKLNVPPSELRKYSLINVRLDRYGALRISKPCIKCQHLLNVFSFSEVWYSTSSQEFTQLQE